MIKFILVGHPRTGSTLLKELLEQNPAVAMYGELFHPVEHERKTTHAIRIGDDAIYYENPDEDAIEFLNRTIWSESNNHNHAIGFKLFSERVDVEGTRRLFVRIKDMLPEVKIIHLVRDNLLDVYVSRKLAEATGVWRLNADDKDNEHKNVKPIHINTDDLTRFFDHTSSMSNFFSQHFAGPNYLEIHYDNLVISPQNEINKIFNFIGVEKHPISIPLKKQNNRKVSETIVNFLTLKSNFSGTRYGKFFLGQEKNSSVITNPMFESQPFTIVPELELGINPFQKRFQGSSQGDFFDAMIASISDEAAEVVSGMPWPKFPPKALQERVHGHSNIASMREAFSFHTTVKEYLNKLNITLDNTSQLLDFGCGWGRMIRPFLRDINLKNIVGVEPNPYFSCLARGLNPYVTIFNSDYHPPTILKDNSFDIVISWSVFSHLPDWLAKEWLNEFHRILKPGGVVFITTWGGRFIERLKRENESLQQGQPIHHYSQIVIEAAGNLELLEMRYQSGDFVFLKSGAKESYGESFVSPAALEKICQKLSVLDYDNKSLEQDMFVLRKIG